MRSRWLGGAAAVLLAAAAGCASPVDDGYACAGLALPAVEVEVREAGTGLPLAAGATGTVTDGGFRETLAVGDPCPGPAGCATRLQGAWERPGRYAVRVEHPGYAAFTASGVVVTRGRCNVRTARLRADLARAP
jgi:hypothetical protein